MSATIRNSVKATKVSSDTFKLIVEAKEVNLVNEAKKTTKEIQAVNNSIVKEAKKAQKEAIKETKDKRKEKAIKIYSKWLDDTQSKTALEKYVKDNKEIILPFLNDTNNLKGSKIDFSQVNKQLFKFGHIHELNKVDYDGTIIENKIVFNLRYMVTSESSLLNRFAKYGSDLDKFKKDSEKATANHLQTKYDTFVKNSGKFFGSQKVVDDLINDTIKKHPHATNQQIVNLINELKKEFLDNI
jgi:hypothetical protein